MNHIDMYAFTIKLNYKMLIKKAARSQHNYNDSLARTAKPEEKLIDCVWEGN